MKGFLIGATAIALPVLPGMILHWQTVDRLDCAFALIAFTVGGTVAALWGLRRGPLEAGRASSMGAWAWVTVIALASQVLYWGHPGMALVIAVLYALPAAAFGILMGHAVYPCIRRI